MAMKTEQHRIRWPFTPTTMIAGALVIAGFMLTGVSWWFLLLVAAGTLGPGLLREFGWLEDRDEFQRRADHRAGYLAFLVTGLVAFVMVAFIRSGGAFEHPERLPSFLLVVLWFTWFFCSLLSYWGAPRTAARTLYVFGGVWLTFTILSNIGSEWTGWAALVLHPLLALPFFVLGWLASHKPRVTGALLLVAFAGFFVLFELPQLTKTGNPASLVSDGGLILFLGPLLASGIALLTMRADELDADTEIESSSA